MGVKLPTQPASTSATRERVDSKLLFGELTLIMSKRDHIPGDPEFSSLRDLSDGAKLAQKLQQHLASFGAGEKFNVASCTVEQVHAKPGGGLRLLFTAHMQTPGADTPFAQMYFGRLLRERKDETHTAALLRARLVAPRFGPPVLFVPEWSLLLWAYPNDPNLAGLPLLLDHAQVLNRMQAAPEKFGFAAAPTVVTSELTKYVPGMRCGYIFRVQFPEGGTAAVYGKAYQDGQGARAFNIMQQIWQSPACRRGDLLLPQPYSYDAENDIIWQQALSGQAFAKVADWGENLPPVAGEIGRRLAAYHGLAMDLPCEKTLAFQVEEVRHAVVSMQKVFPIFAERCRALGERLMQTAAGLENGPVTPLHVSFKFSHVFATPAGLAFIDFDGASLGDPGYDVGRFLAHLYKMKADWKIDPNIAGAAAANFCAAYNRAAAAPLTQTRMDWFAASHLIGSQVYKSIKRVDTGPVNKLLKIAEQLCPP